MDLYMVISQAWPSAIGETYSSNAIDDCTESAKSLVISSVDVIQLGCQSV